jgi:prevent-host-death family protein
MPKAISVADLKRHLSEVIGDVAHGRHTVLVTKRGRPVARLVPVEDSGWSLADVTGWLNDDDPFFKFIDEAVESRRHHAPRAWGPHVPARHQRAQ